jgi:hypothetical protein
VQLDVHKYPLLNFPAFEFRIELVGDKVSIFDISRKKFFVLTPEEWVRQHVIHFLHIQMGYSLALISTENGLKYNFLQKRSDIIIYNKEAKPHILVECKAAEVKITAKAVEQAAVYNKIIKANYILVTNGLVHLVFKLENGHYKQLDQLPTYFDL